MSEERISTPKRIWSKEELVLALDLYFKLSFGNFHSRHPDIIELAKVINRTPGSVAMRLCNYAACDPVIIESGRTGLTGGASQCVPIWNRYANDRDKLTEDAKEYYRKLTGTMNTTNIDVIDENGKLIAITNPDLIDKLRPVLDVQYPSKIAALNIIGDFYGDEFTDTMDFKDWMDLINNINWDNPYVYIKNDTSEENKERKRIRVVTPDGKVFNNKKVVDTLIDVVFYIGLERVYNRRIKVGNKYTLLSLESADTFNHDDTRLYKQITDKYSIHVNSNTPTKYKLIQNLNDEFDLGLTIDLV